MERSPFGVSVAAASLPTQGRENMDNTAKSQWLEKLRSGEYAQGRGRLRSSSNTYCCLGVLAEVAVEAGILSPAVEIPEATEDYHFDGYFCYLPGKVAEAFGVEPVDSDVLMNMNDGKQNSFDEIADWIEKNM